MLLSAKQCQENVGGGEELQFLSGEERRGGKTLF